jgi:hypothetical protein
MRKNYYIADGHRRVRVPGVTTILKYAGDKGGLMNWYFTQGKEAMRLELEENEPPCDTVWDLPKTAAGIGTIVHAMIEADVHGHGFDRTMYPLAQLGKADAAFQAWTRWKAINQFTVVDTELSLVSTEHRFGGTQDITTIGSERTITDFKTGTGPWPEHLLQIAAYAALWRENRPDEPIDSVAILRVSKEDGSFHHHIWPLTSDTLVAAWDGFKAARALYNVYTKHLKHI